MKDDRDLDAELQFHLDCEAAEHQRRGLTPYEARRRALMRLGGVAQTKEDIRDVRGWHALRWLASDARLAARAVRRNPGYALLAILTLAFGLGANTAIFSVLRGVLWKSLPYTQDASLLLLRQQSAQGRNLIQFSPTEVDELRAHCRTITDLVEYHQMNFILLGGPEADRVRTGVVSAGFFDMLGVGALHGRTFRTGEDKPGAAPVLLLSNEYFERRFGADPKVVGRVFRMNDRTYTAVGVLPPLPRFPDVNDVYMPVSACPFRMNPATIQSRRARMLTVLARLNGDSGPGQAQAEVGNFAQRMAREHPADYRPGFGATATLLRDEMTRDARQTFLLLWAAAGLVLWIACANVSSLMLSRLLQREREFLVRAALGAGRARLWSHILTESVLLSLAGGALGLGLAVASHGALVAYAARFTPRASEIGLDFVVLCFTALAAVATGLIAGLLAALAWHGKPLTATRASGSGPSRRRMRQALVVSQVALSFILMAGAGLLLRSAANLARVHPGFVADRVLTSNIMLNWTKYRSAGDGRRFYERLLEKVEAMPGVTSAAVSLRYPMDQAGAWNRNLVVEDAPPRDGAPGPLVEFRTTSTAYFRTIGQPLMRGRLFTDLDRQGSQPVVLVNESLARRYWPGKDPMGRRLSLTAGREWVTIVGIVADVRQYGLDRPAADEVYAPFAQAPFANTLVLRAGGDPRPLKAAIRKTVRDIDPDNAVFDIRTLEEARSDSMSPRRLTTILFGLFAGVTLWMTIAGIYGVMALWVRARTGEIGLRMALGASPLGVLGGVLGHGLRLLAVGLVIGLAAALGVTQLMSTLLFGVSPADPATYLGVAALFAMSATAACWVPARRAASVDPMVALRVE